MCREMKSSQEAMARRATFKSLSIMELLACLCSDFKPFFLKINALNIQEM